MYEYEDGYTREREKKKTIEDEKSHTKQRATYMRQLQSQYCTIHDSIHYFLYIIVIRLERPLLNILL